MRFREFLLEEFSNPKKGDLFYFANGQLVEYEEQSRWYLYPINENRLCTVISVDSEHGVVYFRKADDDGYVYRVPLFVFARAAISKRDKDAAFLSDLTEETSRELLVFEPMRAWRPEEKYMVNAFCNIVEAGSKVVVTSEDDKIVHFNLLKNDNSIISFKTRTPIFHGVTGTYEEWVRWKKKQNKKFLDDLKEEVEEAQPDFEEFDKARDIAIAWYQKECDDWNKQNESKYKSKVDFEWDGEHYWNPVTKDFLIHVRDQGWESADDGVLVRVDRNGTPHLADWNDHEKAHPLANMHDDPEFAAEIQKRVGKYVRINLDEI